ncbi:MAG TPA: phosphoribosylglycinamide formyltransferase [Polyangiales bacterium]|nr:phosphoribosylglycinamide formyltransferase [Polyangiales bacterium]
MPLRLDVLISGRGSNLDAIEHAIAAGRCDAQVALVVSDRASAAGLTAAAERGRRCAVVSLRDYPSRAEWDVALTQRVAEAEPELVVTAGFMRMLGPTFLARFSPHVINLHPALLPLFPGTDGPAQAIRAGVKISGCSVHVVDAGMDTGPILAQAALRVLPDDTPETLHARIHVLEHALLPNVIHAIARGEIQLAPSLRSELTRDDHAHLISPLFDGERS